MDTIYALATARGKAGVAVIRVSGPQSWEAARALAGELPRPRVAALRKLHLGAEALDEAVVLIFEEGASFTGDAVAELHVHGSVATVSAVLSALALQPGLRLAEPGEFTRRALENERLDLSQVEGLSDLIEAETEAQRKQALKVLSGAVGAYVETWRADLVRAAALIEATIDFADEEVPVDVSPEVTELIDRVSHGLRDELRRIDAAERVRDGFEVAILDDFGFRDSYEEQHAAAHLDFHMLRHDRAIDNGRAKLEAHQDRHLSRALQAWPGHRQRPGQT